MEQLVSLAINGEAPEDDLTVLVLRCVGEDTSMASPVFESAEVQARAEDMGALHEALDRFWPALDVPPEPRWKHEMETAIAEIAANIVKHAYADVDTPGPLRLALHGYPDRMEALFHDKGKLFEAVQPPAAVSDIPPTSGYGLALARAATDELRYERRSDHSNVWHLIKRWAGHPPQRQEEDTRP